jgi:serine/threonine-protein kinase
MGGATYTAHRARGVAWVSQRRDIEMNAPALELKWTIPRAGETIAGKYVIEGPCGRGGLAVVLSAIHAGLDQRVAIKMLQPEWAHDGDVVERFLREGRAATRIKSEHVVRVFDVGQLDNGAPYLVLEYLEGHTLEEVISTWAALPGRTAIDWVLQAAEAIGEAHALGIVHRDLKPANLFLTHRPDGSACIKVIDFGLSKLSDPRMSGPVGTLTGPTQVLGSPHYMAPEQLRSTRDADARTDVWALGAVLYELMTGQPPFQGETLPHLCATVLTQRPPRISSRRANVPPPVEQAILRCLEKDPDMRFASVAEMARALAPFGTALALASQDRIERVDAGRPSDLSTWLALPLIPEDDPAGDESPSDVRTAGLVRPSPASLGVVLGSMLMLVGLGGGALMWMYWSVHSGDTKVVHETAARPPALPPPAHLPSASLTPEPLAAPSPAAPSYVAIPVAPPKGPPSAAERSQVLPTPRVHARERPVVVRVEPAPSPAPLFRPAAGIAEAMPVEPAPAPTEPKPASVERTPPADEPSTTTADELFDTRK